MWKKFPSKWYDYLTSNLDQNPRNYGGMSRSEGIFDAETGVVPPMDIDESVKVLGIAMYCWIQGISKLLFYFSNFYELVALTNLKKLSCWKR